MTRCLHVLKVVTYKGGRVATVTCPVCGKGLYTLFPDLGKHTKT